MAVGFPQDLASLNSRAGSLSTGLRDVLGKIEVFKTQLDTITDGQLQSAPYSLTSGDVAVLRSAVADLADFAGLYAGGASSHVTGSYDYRTFSKLLWGFT